MLVNGNQACHGVKVISRRRSFETGILGGEIRRVQRARATRAPRKPRRVVGTLTLMLTALLLLAAADDAACMTVYVQAVQLSSDGRILSSNYSSGAETKATGM